jgi:hypothetical protein
MISLSSTNKTPMCEGNITVTLTESQHELINDVLMNALDAYHLVFPYDDGILDLPIESATVQRYTMLENMKEMFFALWRERFEQ